MEPSSRRLNGKFVQRKVQVVYYLHRRGGHVEHPHLLEGFLLPAQGGLRLRDFKNWLSNLRGNGMPDSFAWSYKRSYKAGYIWQDLSGDDIILPLQKNEYVLMGFELQNQGSKPCKCGQFSPEVAQGETMKTMKTGRRQPSQEEFDLHKLLKEGIIEYINGKPYKDSQKSDGKHTISTCPSFKAENLQTSLTGFSDCDENQAYEMGSAGVSALVKQRSGEVKVYKAKEMEQTTDAATQTGESKRCSTEEALTAPAPCMVQQHLASSLLLMSKHHDHHPGHKPASRSHPSPLFTPMEDQAQSTGHGLLQLKGGSSSQTSSLMEHGTEYDSFTNGHNNTMLSVSTATASNKSEMFYSPSSVHSSCTVLETVSPGSARSLRSVNSVNSTRFSSTADDHHLHLHSSNTVGSCINSGATPSPTKAKLTSSTHLLKQLLSCGSVDISHSSTLNLKALSVRHTPTIATPLNPSNAGTPPDISHGRNSKTRSQTSPCMMHRLCAEDASPPSTPKSWLCRPCGSHGSSCFTPLEAHSNSHHHLSREGSMKDKDGHKAANRTPDQSMALRRSPLLLPPLLNLNLSSRSPKRRDPALVVRSLSGGARELSSAANWTHLDAARKPSNPESVSDIQLMKPQPAADQVISTDHANRSYGSPRIAFSDAARCKWLASHCSSVKPSQPATAAMPALARSYQLPAVISAAQISCHSTDPSLIAAACSPSDQGEMVYQRQQPHYFTDMNCRPDHHPSANLYELVKSGSR